MFACLKMLFFYVLHSEFVFSLSFLGCIEDFTLRRFFREETLHFYLLGEWWPKMEYTVFLYSLFWCYVIKSQDYSYRC